MKDFLIDLAKFLVIAAIGMVVFILFVGIASAKDFAAQDCQYQQAKAVFAKQALDKVRKTSDYDSYIVSRFDIDYQTENEMVGIICHEEQ